MIPTCPSASIDIYIWPRSLEYLITFFFKRQRNKVEALSCGATELVSLAALAVTRRAKSLATRAVPVRFAPAQPCRHAHDELLEIGMLLAKQLATIRIQDAGSALAVLRHW